MSTPSTAGPEVVCSSVSLAFGRNVVLQDISFKAAPGTIHCVIGPNGGGKTCLIKSILGRMRHTGTITVTWEDDNRTIGYVPQQVQLDKTLPVSTRDFIALCVQRRPAFLGIHKSIQQEVQKVLAEVKMHSKEKLLFSELSGGERQRILFAQALIPKPRLLILDEPMNSIDKSGAQIFAEKIQQLASEGVTIIWIHHDLAEVRKIADTVTCINREILFSGKPEEVMDEQHMLEISAPGKVN